jgi:hypothetical protein
MSCSAHRTGYTAAANLTHPATTGSSPQRATKHFHCHQFNPGRLSPTQADN